MSRRKPGPVDTAGAKRPKKANNLHARPEKIPLGTILTDAFNVPWKVGPSIGTGGFGDIYCAYCFTHATPKSMGEYPNVVKIEPHENGPLFVETHFYRKICKADDIESYRKLRKLKHLGMPQYLASGSHTQNGLKHRFLVIPRYGASLQSMYMQNNKCLPLATVFRAGLQMLDVLEYIHSKQYVHADLKGDNILFGMGDRGRERLYLVDFGMACRIVLDDQFKPDPKKKHNGTIEYTSRDAHQGVMTMRGDLEILAYNLIEWAGGILPWKEEKLLKDCNKVQQMKEEGMGDVARLLKSSFRKHITVPKALQPFLEFVNGLRYNETPKYSVCGKNLEKTLKTLGVSNTGVLEVSTVSTTNVDDSSGPMNKTKPKKRRTLDTSVSNGIADTEPNTPDEVEDSEKLRTPKRYQKPSPSLLKQSKGRQLNGRTAHALPDTVPNTPESNDDQESPVILQRSKRMIERTESVVAGPSRVKSAKLRAPPPLPDTIPNTPADDGDQEQELVLSRALSKTGESVSVRAGTRQNVKREGISESRTGRRAKEKTVTVVQSASSQGINIRIETPRKKRTRDVSSESPQEITIKLTLNANVSVNTRGRRNGGTNVVVSQQQAESLESSRNETFDGSQDVIDVSSTTEDNNVSRSLFDDY